MRSQAQVDATEAQEALSERAEARSQQQVVSRELTIAKKGELVGQCETCGRGYIWMNPEKNRIACLVDGGNVKRIRRNPKAANAKLSGATPRP